MLGFIMEHSIIGECDLSPAGAEVLFFHVSPVLSKTTEYSAHTKAAAEAVRAPVGHRGVTRQTSESWVASSTQAGRRESCFPRAESVATPQNSFADGKPVVGDSRGQQIDGGQPSVITAKTLRSGRPRASERR
ncbi:hypothetical protein CPLU01_00375 [Colletotrichum plurivorum]|uniref:Uncharacterized protein n=1 Tax=Colletotrichum plurivorum TaxID=2175906 RepID=A0A8H6NSG1_9PEZI|nr:hypothetical protein CPLU01_00375 [Colletotrichum plurivorum]